MRGFLSVFCWNVCFRLLLFVGVCSLFVCVCCLSVSVLCVALLLLIRMFYVFVCCLLLLLWLLECPFFV